MDGLYIATEIDFDTKYLINWKTRRYWLSAVIATGTRSMGHRYPTIGLFQRWANVYWNGPNLKFLGH